MYYLAYGSNMSSARLLQRLPQARSLGAVRLAGHRLTFDNYSARDQSGKCDALLTGRPTDQVLGVLYRIRPEDKIILDRIEGVGNEYRDAFVPVESPDGRSVEALIYYAINLKSQLIPYSWYREHVLRGALENNFPADYLDAIRRVSVMTDPDVQRSKRELSIYVAAAADASPA